MAENAMAIQSGARKKITLTRLWDMLVPYVFLSPFIISFIILFAFPSVYSLVLSFFSYKGYGKARFLGLDNYKSLLTYRTFWVTVSNTLFYFLVHFIPVMLLGFGIAVAMYSKMLSNMQAIYKPIIFLPQVVPGIAAIIIFKIIFATNYGAFNQIFGLKLDWLADVHLMKWSVVFLITWKSIGWLMVIYLAGLTTISDEIIDACTIDGTNTLQRMYHVVIPMMKPIFLFTFIMDAISSFKIFAEPNVLLSGQNVAPPDAAPVMNILFNNINGGNFGMASAAGWLLFIMIFIVSMIQFRIFRERAD